MSRNEHSFGIIPLRKKEGVWEVLMIRHQGGHWSFPKGHPDPGEDPKVTAARELKEEVNLEVSRFLPLPDFEEHYFFTFQKERINKKVTYFAAEVQGKVVIQQDELADFRWLSLNEGILLATFEEAKNIIKKLQQLVLNKNL